MTTSPVVSATDELIAELEEEARGALGEAGSWYSAATFADFFVDAEYLALASPATILALLAERAELKRDAERWRAVKSAGGELTLRLHNTRPRDRAHVIDAAMQSEAKP